MNINRIDLLLLGLLSCLVIFLFVQAPKPLAEKGQSFGDNIPVATLFKIVAHENNIARTNWTKLIVGDGLKAGLKFDEDWRKKEIEAGPLPALFLREVSTHLEKSEVPLGLFLGSDFPIAPVNKFEGQQVEAFKKIRQVKQPQFFYDEDVARYTAMFPDIAGAKPCVSCHNDHKDSPKTDWVLNDIMGATTWIYPNKTVTRDELSNVIIELRSAFAKTYISFTKKLATFKEPPIIGGKWPSDGYFIPHADVFLAKFKRDASKQTLELLLQETPKENLNKNK